MADVIGKVEGLEGKFFVQDSQGNTRELKNGDEVYEGETIVPDTNNAPSASASIVPADGTPPLKIDSTKQQMLDKTLLNEGLNNEDLAFNPEAVQDALVLNNQNPDNEEEQTAQFAQLDGAQTDVNSDLRQKEFNGDQKEPTDGNNQEQTEPTAQFAALDGAATDVNSDLRQRQFGGNNSDYTQDGQETQTAQFAALDGGRTDVNSDLRQRQFGGNDSDYTQDGQETQAAQFAALDGGRTDVNSDLRQASWPGMKDFADIQNDEGVTGGIDGGSGFATRDGAMTDVVSDLRQAEWFGPIEEPTNDGDVDNNIVDLTPAPIPITLKIFAIDSNGNEGSVNDANEGETVNYIVRAFNGDTEVTLTGDVNIIFNDATAKGNETQTLLNGSQDFDNTTQTVKVGEQFSTTLFDEYVRDNDENFTLYIEDNSYNGSSTGYIVNYDTTPVTTTIRDNPVSTNQPTDETNIDNSTGSYGTADTVYATITNDTTVNEGSDGTYTVQLLDKDGNAVKVSEDTAVTVKYTNTTTQDGDTEHSNDTNITVTLNAGSSSQTFNITTIDDYLSDDGEQFNLEITDVDTTEFENVNTQGYTDTNTNVHVNNVTTTISDAGAGTNKVYAVITDDTNVNEGSTGTYTVKLQDIDGNPIVVTQNTDVTVIYTNTTTQDGDTEHNNNTTITVTIPVNGSSNTFTVNTLDDNIADNGEEFNLEITAVDTIEFETINTQGYTDTNNNVHVNNVTTTISDNTGKPDDNSNGTPPENNSEDVTIKLVACDTNGNPIFAGDGITYTFVNEVPEGGSAKYMALAFNSSTVFDTDTKTTNQVGAVIVSTADTSTDGSTDYQTTTTQVAILGTAFDVQTKDDYIKENDEIFTVSINANSYGSNSGSDVYENVTESGTVITTITDGADDAIPNQDVDTVYLELSGDDIQGEILDEKLTHTINLVDKDGNAVNLTTGKSIEVSLTYSDIAGKDGIEAGDLSTKVTTFTLTGDGGSSYSFDNIIAKEGGFELSESYNVKIGSITTDNTDFENVAISTAQNSANGTIVEGVVVEGGNLINGTSQELVQGLGAFNTITTFTYKDESGNTQTGIVGTPTNTIYGTITIASNGDWSYTSDPTEDHSNGVLLDTITYTVTDGATVTQHEFPILVTDTVPEAINDNATTPRTVVENAVAITGNVITNTADISADIVQADTIEVTTFTYKDVNGDDATANVGTSVTEQNGTLTVNQDGSWTYTPNKSVDNSSGAVSANFDYTITDSDGDTSSATQYINILDDDVAIPTINNLNNTPVVVYEGDAKSTFNGTDTYDKSDTNANKDTTATATHKLDFSTGTDAAGITSFTFDGTTSAAIPVGGSQTVTDNDKGILTVHYDGTWEYTPPAFYIHPDANGINNFQETFTYTVTDIDGDAVTTGSQDIQVDDTLATFGTSPTDVTIDEKYLPSGTAPDGTNLTKTEAINIDVSKLSGAHDVTFAPAGSQDDFTLNDTALSSLGNEISHVVSADGHTLTMYTGGDSTTNHVMVVTINNPTSSTPSYTAVLYKAFDHETLASDGTTPLLENGNLEFDFKIALNDDDKDPSSETFTVSIIDDASPDNQTMIVDEDSTDTTITTNADVTQGNTSITAPNQGTYGTGSITPEGKFLYVPDADFSGEDSVTYTTTLDDGTTKDVTVTITVNPIADAPTVNVSNVSAIEDASDNTDVNTGNNSEGTNIIALGLTKPTINDTIDQNDGDIITGAGVTAGDHPERLGYIELKFTNGADVNGAVVEKSGGEDLFTVSTNNQVVKVFITDDANYHHADLDPDNDAGTILKLTQVEYEALKIIHAEDNDTDIKINIATTSYEVNDSGVPLDTASATLTKTSSDDMSVTIRPVTDDISLIWDTATDGNITTVTNTGDTFTFTTAHDEGYYFTNPLDLDALLSKTSGFASDASGDLDGSEQRKYTIEDIPEGSVVTIGGQSATADSSEKIVIRLNNANEKLDDHSDFSLKLPEDYAGIINGKITLSVYDKGADSGDTIGDTIEKVVYFKNMQVNPVADGIGTINAAQATGLEDAGRANGNTTNDGTAGDITAPADGIDLNITATTLDTSGREKVTMTIDKVPDGGALYYDDGTSAITVDETGTVSGANANVTVDATANGTFKVTIVDFKNDAPLKFIPPHNSKEDYTFDVSAKTVDSVADIAGESISATKDTTIDVSVTGVADIPVNDDFKTLESDGTTTGGIYSAVTTEDTDTDGTTPNDGAVISFASLYADTGLNSYDNSIIGTDNPETLSVVITGLGSDFSVVASDGGELSASGISFNGLSGASREWSFGTADLSKVEILTSKNYSGSMEFKVKHVTTEDDGNSKSDEKDVKVLVKPVAEATITTSSDVTEDVASQVDFSIVQENGESGEALDTLWIRKTDGNGELGIDGKDFTLYTNSGATTTLASSATAEGDYYKLTDINDINSVYIKYNQDIGKSNTTHNSFGIKYTVSDSFSANSETFTDTETVTTGVYSIPLLSKTDIIGLDTSDGAVASTGTITYDDSDNSLAGNIASVTIDTTGTFSLDLDLTSEDKDNSEDFTRFVIENVQRGISVVDVNATMAISGGNTNIWFLDIPTNSQEMTGGDNTYTVNFEVNQSLQYSADTSTVKITAYSKDTGSAADDIQEATKNIEFINNLHVEGGPGATSTIDVDMNVHDVTVTEDTQFALDGIIETLLPTGEPNDSIADGDSVTYTLAFSDLTHVSFDKENDTYTDNNVNSYGGEHYITVTAAKSAIQTQIETVLSQIKMLPNENYNQNNAASQLSFGVKLTAYVGEGWARDTTDVKTLDVDVVPVTDDISSIVAQSHVDEDDANAGSAQEDGTTTINITLDSVDKNPLGGGANDAVYSIVTADGSATATTIAISHTGGVYGILTWSGGSHTFSDGNLDASVLIADISNGSLTFSPTAHASGTANFSYTVYAQENGAANISTTTNTFSINVAAVADGLNLPEPKGQGDEDSYIQIYSDLTNQTPLDGATMIDTDDSESILSMYIDNVPDDFLIYIGESGSQTLASKGSDDGDVNLGDGVRDTFQWSINISGGIPKVWIKAPEDWSSTTPIDLGLRTVVKDGTDTTIVTKPFSVTVDSVVDGFSSLTSNPAVQAASVDVAINLNANAGDLDGSETGILTLSGFGANDVTFKQDGTPINAIYSGDTYTISNIDLSTTKLNTLTFQKAGLQGASIDYTFKTVEGDDNTKISSVESGSFTATTDNVITDTTAAGTDGQDDRLVLTADQNIDFSTISSTSIDKLDLTQNGDHDITNVTMQDVLNMTDGNNELIIIADDGNDSVQLTDDGGNTWSQGSNITYGGQTFETYTNGDATVKVSVDDSNNTIVI
jgi:VCBS repeat-containing protein